MIFELYNLWCKEANIKADRLNNFIEFMKIAKLLGEHLIADIVRK